MRHIGIVASLMIVSLAGCGRHHVFVDPTPLPRWTEPSWLRIEAETALAQDVLGLGAGQGVEVRDGLVYAYGDADTGVIVELRVLPADTPRLRPTGRVLRLTHRGEDLIPHPTGLTFHPDYGTWIGNTVRRVGTMFHIDWERAWADGHLDHALLHVVADDAAVNGTRPEFVRVGDRWLIATSDYGDVENAVRLYDPALLAEADRTSWPGVQVASFACSPFVQTLYWHDPAEALVLVQNTTPGLGWRLTAVAGWSEAAFAGAEPFDGFAQADELEGFHVLPDGESAVFVTAHRHRNAWLGAARFVPAATAVRPDEAGGAR